MSHKYTGRTEHCNFTIQVGLGIGLAPHEFQSKHKISVYISKLMAYVCSLTIQKGSEVHQMLASRLFCYGSSECLANPQQTKPLEM